MATEKQQFSEHPNKSPLMGWGSAQINCLGAGCTASQESTVSKTMRLLLTLQRRNRQCEFRQLPVGRNQSACCPVTTWRKVSSCRFRRKPWVSSAILGEPETSRNWEACDLWQKPEYRFFSSKKLQSANHRSKMEMDLGIRGCQKLTKNLLDNNLHLLIHHALRMRLAANFSSYPWQQG